jgi:HK97 family phage major capsid protein
MIEMTTGRLRRIPYGEDRGNVAKALRDHLLRGPEKETRQIGLMDTRTLAKFRASLTRESGPAGRYAIDTGTFSESLELALLDQAPMRRLATVQRMGGNSDLFEPTTNDTSNEGEFLPDNGQISDLDVVFGLLTLTLYKIGSKRVVVPNDLWDDAMPDFLPKLGRILGERCARTANRLFTTGNGASQPVGIMNAAPTGQTAASPTAISADDCEGLLASVDPAYRVNPSTVWMANAAIWKAIRTLKDSAGRYLLEHVGEGYPGRFLGYPCMENPHMPATIASGNKTLLFGDFSRYKIREAGEANLLVWREAPGLIDQFRSAFYLVLRTDGALLDAGTGPVKALKH